MADQIPPEPNSETEAAPKAAASEPFHLPFSVFWPLIAGAAYGIAMRLVFSGISSADAGPANNDVIKNGEHAFTAMMASFIYGAPFVVGMVTVFTAEMRSRRTWWYYFWSGSAACTLMICATLIILIEGIICAILIVPLFVIAGGLGGVVMGAMFRITKWARHTLYSVAALPILLGGIEQQLPLPARISTVERSVLVNATPENVWRHLESTPDIKPNEVEHAWMFRIGVPLPTSGATRHTADGIVRHVSMGKGIHFEQIATQWEPNRHVNWKYRFKPDSFPPNALDDHVMIGGHYFDLIDTSYTLVPRGSHTELQVKMRYRVSTQFNWYAQPIAEFLIGNFEDVILSFYARRAEGDSKDQIKVQ